MSKVRAVFCHGTNWKDVDPVICDDVQFDNDCFSRQTARRRDVEDGNVG